MADDGVEAIKVDGFQVAQGPGAVVVRFVLITEPDTRREVTVALTPRGALELSTQLGQAATGAAMGSTPASFRQ